jgi:hypothetical protein
MIVKRFVCLLKAFDRRLDGYSVIRVQWRIDRDQVIDSVSDAQQDKAYQYPRKVSTSGNRLECHFRYVVAIRDIYLSFIIACFQPLAGRGNPLIWLFPIKRLI